MKTWITLVALGLAPSCFAAAYTPFVSGQTLPFMRHGIVQPAYEACQKALKQCPTSGPFLQPACVASTVSQQAQCSQLEQLAKTLGQSADQLSLVSQGGFTVVRVNFPADGQAQYYLISPLGQLFDTQIDPRTLDKVLAQRYVGVDFMLQNQAAPRMQQAAGGGYDFLGAFAISKGCMACARVGDARLRFSFSAQGALLKVSVDQFKPSQN